MPTACSRLPATRDAKHRPEYVNTGKPTQSEATDDIYALYLWINVKKVPNLKIRQAMAVALNRDALRKNAGGVWVGDFADGVIKPNIGPDYAATGMWTDMFGKAIPDTGDPDLAPGKPGGITTEIDHGVRYLVQRVSSAHQRGRDL